MRGGASTISSGGRTRESVTTSCALRLQSCARHLIGLPRFDQDHNTFGAGHGIGHPEHRHAAFMHAGNAGDSFLDLLRIEVPARAYDDVLDAAGDVDVTAGHVTAVAGVEPVAVEKFACFCFVVKIAARGRWATKLDPSFPALAELAAHLVNDADLVVGQRLAAGDDFERPWMIRRRPLGNAATT